MRISLLSLPALLLVAFNLAAWLEPWFQNWAGNRARSANLLQVALGDGRRLFARHFYVKADEYFHSGHYPSIYDLRPDSDKVHMATGAGTGQQHHQDMPDFLGAPKDWLDAFSRKLFPSAHRHLGDHPADGEHAGHEGPCDHSGVASSAGEERELLPWLRFSATLDPERPETYLVASYWLRSRLDRVNEAEQFLREGLRHNPGDHELLFELGQICSEHRKDMARARNLWELAAKEWQQREAGKAEPKVFAYGQILGHLATLEEREGNFARAAEHLEQLLQVTPYPDHVKRWLEEVRARQKRP